jgi:hypothetical protein
MRAQAEVLGDRLTISARRAAEDLLNASEKAIVAALAPYGGFTFERLQKVATIVADSANQRRICSIYVGQQTAGSTWHPEWC